MEIYKIIIMWLFLGLFGIWYLHVRNKIGTWNKEQLIRRKSVSLEDIVKMYSMLEELSRILRLITFFIPVIVALLILMDYNDPFTLRFCLWALPVPVMCHFMYRVFCLYLERAQELCKGQS
ncbi:MAG: hypothetical protein WBA22_09910 [Candidatus Methanofastidiosia archaeon]